MLRYTHCTHCALYWLGLPTWLLAQGLDWPLVATAKVIADCFDCLLLVALEKASWILQFVCLFVCLFVFPVGCESQSLVKLAAKMAEQCQRLWKGRPPGSSQCPPLEHWHYGPVWMFGLTCLTVPAEITTAPGSSVIVLAIHMVPRCWGVQGYSQWINMVRKVLALTPSLCFFGLLGKPLVKSLNAFKLWSNWLDKKNRFFGMAVNQQWFQQKWFWCLNGESTSSHWAN